MAFRENYCRQKHFRCMENFFPWTAERIISAMPTVNRRPVAYPPICRRKRTRTGGCPQPSRWGAPCQPYHTTACAFQPSANIDFFHATGSGMEMGQRSFSKMKID